MAYGHQSTEADWRVVTCSVEEGRRPVDSAFGFSKYLHMLEPSHPRLNAGQNAWHTVHSLQASRPKLV